MSEGYLEDFKPILHSTYNYMIEKMEDWKDDKIGAIYPAIFAIISPVYETFDTEGEAVHFRKEMLSDILDFINEIYYGHIEGNPYPFLMQSINDFFHVVGYLYYQIKTKGEKAKTIGEVSWPGHFASWRIKHKGIESEIYSKINHLCHSLRYVNPLADRDIDKVKDISPEFWWVVDVLKEKYSIWEKYVHEKWRNR